MLTPTNFPSTKNAASLVAVVTAIPTSNLSPLELVSSMVPLAQLSVFRPRGVPGPTSKLSLRAPAQMGWRETGHKGGKTAASCCPVPEWMRLQ
jgi:hypothetical protein